MSQNQERQLKLINDMQELIDSYVVMKQLASDKISAKVGYYITAINIFKRKFVFTRIGKRAIIINVNALTNEINVEIDEMNLILNTSRYKPLKKYKRIVVYDAKQGKRIIQIPIKKEQEAIDILDSLWHFLEE